MSQKYDAPQGAPPGYPAQAHFDAGPAPYDANRGENSGYYGGPPPQQYGQPGYGQPPYGQPPYGQPPYGQPPYGQPPYGQQPMMYQQQGPYPQQPYGQYPPPGGRDRGVSGGGICAGIMGALACCCCLDILF